MTAIEALVRPNIRTLKAYSSARSEFEGAAEIFLDANENPFDTGLNRYPDPLQKKVKHRIAEVIGGHPENLFLGNGSDEVIDLLIRIFCEPGKDHIITLPPTYGMYQVSASIANVENKKISLMGNFQIDVQAVLKAANEQSKLLFICSPNNPTGNDIRENDIRQLAENFPGLVVVDEAYIDFSNAPGCIDWIAEYENLIVMRTFSKAWGLAGIRLGMAFASTEIIRLFNKVKPPYNINQLTQRAVLETLENTDQKVKWIEVILNERARVQNELKQFSFVQEVYSSAANFLLVKMKAPDWIYQSLVKQGIIVRNRSKVKGCEGCLRFTIGTPDENDRLLNCLQKL